MTERDFTLEERTVLQRYIYLYSYPDSFPDANKRSKIFYVGKGQGNRVFEHLGDASESEKVEVIQEIRENGQQPKIELIAWNLWDDAVTSLVERVVIDLIGVENLTNQNRGQGAHKFERITTVEWKDRYGSVSKPDHRDATREFKAIQSEYEKIAPAGFREIGRIKKVWAAVSASDWPPEWADRTKYNFQLHSDDGVQKIGVEIFIEQQQPNQQKVVATVQSFKPELELSFPGPVKGVKRFEYAGLALAIMFERTTHPLVIAGAMVKLIEKTQDKLKAVLQEAYSSQA
ncbi:MAG: GIY-YIG nuclease family protein [Chloroflexi bacterium]|nr:GIY-YIG nuclease family protein [Chloroflexota bacterium]